MAIDVSDGAVHVHSEADRIKLQQRFDLFLKDEFETGAVYEARRAFYMYFDNADDQVAEQLHEKVRVMALEAHMLTSYTPQMKVTFLCGDRLGQSFFAIEDFASFLKRVT